MVTKQLVIYNAIEPHFVVAQWVERNWSVVS